LTDGKYCLVGRFAQPSASATKARSVAVRKAIAVRDRTGVMESCVVVVMPIEASKVRA